MNKELQDLREWPMMICESVRRSRTNIYIMAECLLMRLTNASGETGIKLLKKYSFYFSGANPSYSDPKDELSYNLPENTSLVVFAGPDPDKSFSQYGGFCYTLSAGQSLSNRNVNTYSNGSSGLYFYLITVTETNITVSYECSHTGYGSFSMPAFISCYGAE